jgi:hypothetical protein
MDPPSSITIHGIWCWYLCQIKSRCMLLTALVTNSVLGSTRVTLFLRSCLSRVILAPCALVIWDVACQG